MAEDRESSDRNHEKSKKRDRLIKADLNVWTTEDKLQLAEAIDMYGVEDVKRLAKRIPNKTFNQVMHMLRQLRQENHKLIECEDMKNLPFVNLNGMKDIFIVSGTKPKEVMIKWMEYLEMTYNNDPYQFDKFKLFSNAFLIMAECTPSLPPKTTANTNDLKDGQGCELDFKKVYYFLYRIFNNYYVSKTHWNSNMRQYLYELFLRVLEDIEYTSDNEKVAMYNIVANWTGVNRLKNTRVYGNTIKLDEEDDMDELIENKPNLKKPEYKVLQQPMIPSFNPLCIRSSSSDTTLF